MRTLRIRSFSLLIVVGTLACAKAPVPVSTPLAIPVAPPPIAQPEEPPLAVLEKDILEQYRVRVAQALAQESDDKDLTERLKILNRLIEEMQAEIEGLETRKPLGTSERDRYSALASLLAKQRKKRDEEIDASYRHHVVEFRELNLFLIPPDARRALQANRGEIEKACKLRRKIIVLGFGCSKGPAEVTERISALRATSVDRWLRTNAGCQKRDIFSQGLGVEFPEEDITAIDPVDLEPLLETSRHALLLMPR